MAEETREEWLARMRSISVMGGGRFKSRNTKEYRDPTDGHRVKVTKDEVTERGNLITEHNTKDDRVDVLVRPDGLQYGFGRK
jgi:hypothetical protein